MSAGGVAHGSRRGFLGAAIAVTLWPMRSGASDYPVRPVRLLVGQAPGGQTDTIARAVAQRLSERWQMAVVVENQAGASGTIAARTVAHAPPDGHTLLLGSSASLVLAPVTLGDVGYDPLRDLVVVGRIARVTYGLVVRAELGTATLREFVALARERPGALTVATVGPASSVGILATQFARAAGIDLLQVPYKGGAPGVQALLAGQVDATICDVSAVRTQVAAGALRLLALVGPQRSQLAPDVPTLRESGYAGVGDDPWYALAAPAQTPAAVIESLYAAVRATTQDPEMRRRFGALGYEMFDESQADSARALSAELAHARATLGGTTTR